MNKTLPSLLGPPGCSGLHAKAADSVHPEPAALRPAWWYGTARCGHQKNKALLRVERRAVVRIGHHDIRLRPEPMIGEGRGGPAVQVALRLRPARVVESPAGARGSRAAPDAPGRSLPHVTGHTHTCPTD